MAAQPNSAAMRTAATYSFSCASTWASVSSVLSSLVDLANRWGALTIAEGIETAAQLETVRSIGVDAAQGYFLGRPSPLPVAVNQPFPTTTQTFDFSAALDARRRLARAAG